MAMALPKPGSHLDPGVRIQILPLWLSVNSISSPDNGFSEERRRMANVGVYPCISTEGRFNIKVATVIFWSAKNFIISPMQRGYRWATLRLFIPWLCNFFFIGLLKNY